MTKAFEQQFVDLEDRFNKAMISNAVAQIAACISDDWVLVTPEIGPVSRDGMLGAIASGVLSHDTMTKETSRIKVYGDVAVVTGRGRNTGMFKNKPIAADEWITNIYRKIDGDWKCVLTHLTPVANGG